MKYGKSADFALFFLEIGYNKDRSQRKREDFKVDSMVQLKVENETLKSLLKEMSEQVQSLEKLNNWYIEQLKLRQKEKFGRFSEKAGEGQITLFDLFNEVETIKEPFVQEPTEEIIVNAYKKKKAKRGENFSNLPVETIEYKLGESEMVCDICSGVHNL